MRRQRSGELGWALKSSLRFPREASIDDLCQGEGKRGPKVPDSPVSPLPDRLKDLRFGIAGKGAFQRQQLVKA